MLCLFCFYCFKNTDCKGLHRPIYLRTAVVLFNTGTQTVKSVTWCKVIRILAARIIQDCHNHPSDVWEWWICCWAFILVSHLFHCAWAISSVAWGFYIKHYFWWLFLYIADFLFYYFNFTWLCCDLYAAFTLRFLNCVWFVFCAAAASGSSAVSAPGPGSTHDPSATGPEPANPPRRHHLLWSLLPLLPAGLTSPAGQGGEGITRRSRQPPRRGRRQVWLIAFHIQFFLSRDPNSKIWAPILLTVSLWPKLAWTVPSPLLQQQTLNQQHFFGSTSHLQLNKLILHVYYTWVAFLFVFSSVCPFFAFE